MDLRPSNILQYIDKESNRFWVISDFSTSRSAKDDNPYVESQSFGSIFTAAPEMFEPTPLIG